MRNSFELRGKYSCLLMYLLATQNMVSQGIENVTNVTRQLNSSIEEIKSSAGDLSKLATELNTMAGWFKT